MEGTRRHRSARRAGGARPAAGLVISNDEHYALRNDRCMAVPVTGRTRVLPFRVRDEPPAAGLAKTSLIMGDQERTQGTDRLVRRPGQVPGDTQHQRMVGRSIDAHRIDLECVRRIGNVVLDEPQSARTVAID